MLVTTAISKNPDWQGSTAYSLGERVHNDSPNRLYECVTAGTSASSGGPTGTGTSISDGTAEWDYVVDVDYETISAWESDLDNSGVYNSGDDAVGECYDGTEYDEDVIINGGNTVGLNSRTLSVAEGERGDGTAGTGARIVASISGVMFGKRDKTFLEWLEIDSNDVEYRVGFLNNFKDEYRIKNVLFHGWTGNTANTAMVGGSDARDTVIQNCIVYDCDLSGTGGPITGIVSDFNGAGKAPAGILNNTVHAISQSSGGGDAFGIETNGNATDQEGVVNNLCTSITATGTATCFDTFAGSPFTNNMSEDTSGNSGLTGITPADQYEETTVGMEDLHLKSGADAIDAGADIGTSPTNVNIDINGNDRTGITTWDIGAHEFELDAGGGGTYSPVIERYYRTLMAGGMQ